MPSEALREAQQAPAGFLEEVIEARGYTRAKALWESATDRRQLPQSEMLDWVKQIDFDLAQQAMKGGDDGG